MMLLRHLLRDRRGAALTEFAYIAPLVLAIGGYGIELGNMALVNLKVSQIALTLADNASRIGVNNGQALFQLREGDLGDILQSARLLGAGIGLTTNGRVTISSLENVQRQYADGTTDSAPVQRIHWQRCVGLKTGPTGSTAAPLYDSNYGQATPLATAATDATQANAGVSSSGMGASPVVTAISGNGVIFVEINYQYQPVFGKLYAKPKNIHYVASFIVRDNRDFSRIYNPPTALATTPARMTCDLHAA